MRGLNYDSALTTEDFAFLERVLTQETLERTRALFGAYLDASSHGIVDKKDPAAISTTDTDRPLQVKANGSNAMLFDVTIGAAFSKSGEWLFLTQPLQGLLLPTSTVGQVVVVSLKKTEVTFDERLTKFNYLVAKFRSRPGDDPSAETPPTSGEIAEAEKAMISAQLLADYEALSQEDKDDRVVLAVIKIVDGPALSIDYTRASYSFNRPWFSPADIAHRSKVGSGVVTDNDPHGLAISDLSVGDLTALQLWIAYGVIVAKDLEFAKLPGFKCVDTIPQLSILNDDAAGSISGLPEIPGAPAKLSRLVQLTNYPVRLLRIHRASDNLELSGFIVPGTSVVCIPPHETDALTGDVVITTTAVSAAQPPTGQLVASGTPRVGANLTRLSFLPPVDGRREVMIARGLEFTDLPGPTATLLDYGTIPIEGRVVLDKAGNVQLVPQVLACQSSLNTAGSAEQKVAKTFLAPGRLRVALTGAAAGPTMQVQIQLRGKDASGGTVQETVTFDSTWTDSTPPSCAENPNQFGKFGSGQKLSTNVFSELTSWQVLLRQNDGINSAVVVYVEPDSVKLEASDVLPLASFRWDGTKTCDLRDDRPISLVAALPGRSPVIAEGLGLVRNLSPAPVRSYVEDFAAPQFMDATQSSMSRSYAGCRGPAPDGVLTKATYVSRALVGRTDQIGGGAPAGPNVTIFPIMDPAFPELDPAKVLTSLQVRAHQGQAAGAWGALVNAQFGVAVAGASLGGGNAPINRVQVFLTTNNLGNRLRGIAVAIVS